MQSTGGRLGRWEKAGWGNVQDRRKSKVGNTESHIGGHRTVSSGHGQHRELVCGEPHDTGFLGGRPVLSAHGCALEGNRNETA